jgi:ketosteroid isomerase-like protein
VGLIDFAAMKCAWIAAIAAVAVLAGCGGGDELSAADVAGAYVQARNQGDAAKVCELYSQQLVASLKTSNCVAFIQEQTSGTATDLSVIRVSEKGDHATATIQARVGGNVANAIAPIQLQLSKESGEWRVSGIGGQGSQ